ncbi:MAG: amino acid permease [Rhodospirillales bacterium]|nr:amino acid permease [Rhodospirillales bacterium]
MAERVPEPGAESGLNRRLGLLLLTLYGLGTTVGAGIYVLVGKVAGRAGEFAPVSFLLAAALAGLTALSYAELSSRFPKSAGEAVYVSQGLGRASLAILVGFLVIGTGVVSAATLSQGFSGYFGTLVAVPGWLSMAGVVLILTGFAAWGIAQSVIAASLLTVFEVVGLVMVIWAGRGIVTDPGAIAAAMTPPIDDALAWTGILTGSYLAFFAFIGFEDMVNVAEEVKDERRTIPAAIGLTLLVTTVLYLCISVISVNALPVAELAASPAPLVAIYERLTGAPGTLLKLIGSFAVINGALIQIIMASRVVYGMASQGWLPAGLACVNGTTRTPLVATGLVGMGVLVLAFSVRLELLAETTTLFIFGVFALCNAALFRLKWTAGQDIEKDTEIVRVPIAVPALGAVFSALFFVLTLLDLIERAGG